MRHRRAHQFLIFPSVGFTVSLTSNGRVLVVLAPYQGLNGADTALTDLFFSRLGTGPMWPCTRSCRFLSSCIPEILTEFYSKYYSRMLLTLPKRTRIKNIGPVWPRTSEHLIGTGLPIASRLPRLSLWKRSTSSRLMVRRLAWRTRSSSTLSTLSTRLSNLLIALGGRQ